MPNPKTGTVTMEIEKAVREIKAGKVEYRVDKAAIVHVGIGKASFSLEQLQDNFRSLMARDCESKAPAAKRNLFEEDSSLSSTMGPGVRVNPNSIFD